jgi:hypothetical protein
MMQIVSGAFERDLALNEITKADNTHSLSKLSVSLPPCLSRPILATNSVLRC